MKRWIHAATESNVVTEEAVKEFFKNYPAGHMSFVEVIDGNPEGDHTLKTYIVEKSSPTGRSIILYFHKTEVVDGESYSTGASNMTRGLEEVVYVMNDLQPDFNKWNKWIPGRDTPL